MTERGTHGPGTTRRARRPQDSSPCRAGSRGSRRLGGIPIVGFLLLATALSAGAASGAPAAAPAPASPRATMRLVFEEMKTLVPLALDERRWSEPATRAKVLGALDRLDRAASLLERHGRSREVGFGTLALNLGNDLREARDHYAAGAYPEARFFLTGSLQSCVACHTRLPSDRAFPIADELTGQLEIQALDPRERAWLRVMVRDFEAALDEWESLLLDPEVPPGQLDATGALVDYLNVVLRVEQDLPRAQRSLTRFAARDDLPVYLERRVRAWREALAGLDGTQFGAKAPASVELGAKLAEQASRRARGPYGRDGLVEDLAAASQLVRFLEQDRAREAATTRNLEARERLDRARAYYWLGVVEARSLDGFWVNLSERHFEAAVRTDPKGPFAERAYAELEEIQVLGFGGASGEHLPADVWTNLRELRELMGRE